MKIKIGENEYEPPFSVVIEEDGFNLFYEIHDDDDKPTGVYSCNNETLADGVCKALNELADLRATHEKLVELAKIQNQLCELRPTICDVGNDTGVQSWVNALARQRQLLSDPLVVKAMERMEK